MLLPLLFLLLLPSGLPAERKNVLLLVADDFRPNLGLYDETNQPLFASPHMITPHLDQLASRSLVFDKAFCQTSLCGPSRASFLTGRRPDTTKVHGNGNTFREVGGNFTTLPGYFKAHGYRTLSSGKIFHGYHNNSKHNDFPWSWSQRPFQAEDIDIKNMSYHLFPEDSLLQDVVNTENAVDQLRELAPAALLGQQNFFLGLGIHKPHMPWDFPARFYDLYPADSIELPYNKHAPVGMPEMAWGDFSNPRKAYWDWNNEHLGIPDLGQINVTFPNWKLKQIRRAYYASVSFMDEQMGRILTELDELGLADSTVVAFLGDHGYQLGEHAQHVKWNNFEITNRVPMLVAVPGKKTTHHSDQLVELVDLYPTLVELAGLPPLSPCPQTSSQVEVCTEGSSMAGLLDGKKEDWKTAVFYQRAYEAWAWNASKVKMAYSIRTASMWRYTEYVYMKQADGGTHLDWENTEYVYMKQADGGTHLDWQPNWDRPADIPELYNLKVDPWETRNLGLEEEWSQVRQELSIRLRLGWRGEMAGNGNL